MPLATRIALLQLARTENVGPISFFHLLQRFGSPEEALQRLPSLTKKPVNIPSPSQALREIERHDAKGYQLISFYDPMYPVPLRALRDAPPFLSVRGRVALLQEILFAIIGARHASQPSERLATALTQGLGERWGIVSGLAKGLDACVHHAALDLVGTIAVVAGSVDSIYPPENKKLHQQIAEQGLIVSESALDQQPCAPLFIRRNRLISGLCWGTLIIEASVKSGSLITAKYALEQGRTVFAVPGHPLDFRARGTNKLIKQGACLVESAQDVLQEYKGASAYTYTAREESSPWGQDHISGMSIGHQSSLWESWGLQPLRAPESEVEAWASTDTPFPLGPEKDGGTEAVTLCGKDGLDGTHRPTAQKPPSCGLKTMRKNSLNAEDITNTFPESKGETEDKTPNDRYETRMCMKTGPLLFFAPEQAEQTRISSAITPSQAGPQEASPVFGTPCQTPIDSLSCVVANPSTYIGAWLDKKITYAQNTPTKTVDDDSLERVMNQEPNRAYHNDTNNHLRNTNSSYDIRALCPQAPWLLQRLTTAPLSIDALAQSVQLPISTVRSALVLLELEGLIAYYPGDQVMLAQSMPVDWDDE